MASLAPIFAPDRIAIGGGLAEVGGPLLEPAEESFRSTAGRFYHQHVDVRQSVLGWKAGVIGAATLALQI
jgi:predicted NBD/HSP70 family sugar kinase